MLFRSIRPTTLVLGLLCASSANAQWYKYPGSQYTPWWNHGNPGQEFAEGHTVAGSVLLSHAIIASAVWVLLIPSAAILLRLNIRSPWVLRVHATLQIVSYILFVAAAGMGIWLVDRMSDFVFNYGSMWNDPHPVIGLVILVLALVQPVLGAIHHRLFKKRVAAAKDSKPAPAPGRTVPGHIHLWLGRLLIALGIINGGLGIRLTSIYPFQSPQSTRTAAYIYGFIVGAMFLLYLVIVVRFERNKAKRDRENANLKNAPIPIYEIPPTYTESQEAVQKNGMGAARYG